MWLERAGAPWWTPGGRLVREDTSAATAVCVRACVCVRVVGQWCVLCGSLQRLEGS